MSISRGIGPPKSPFGQNGYGLFVSDVEANGAAKIVSAENARAIEMFFMVLPFQYVLAKDVASSKKCAIDVFSQIGEVKVTAFPHNGD